MKLENQTDCVVDCTLSLQVALNKAGGIVQGLDRLQEMSAYDLINLIAPNGIRFTWNPNKVLSK